MLAGKISSAGALVRVVTLYMLLTALAFVAARGNSDVLFATVLNTVRVTLVLYTLAMCAFLLSNGSAEKQSDWLLLWTFAFISYAVHFFISFFGFFGGSFTYFYEDQGALVAIVNLVVTAWWTLDVILAWVGTPGPKWIATQRVGIHYLIWATFFMSTVIFHNVDHKQGFVVLLGIAQAITIGICIFLKIKSGHKPMTAPAVAGGPV